MIDFLRPFEIVVLTYSRDGTLLAMLLYMGAHKSIGQYSHALDEFLAPLGVVADKS